MNRTFIRNNCTSVAIVIFIISYAIILFLKPNFIFNKDGSLRDFGIGFTKKTIVPAWLTAILIAILSYFSVLYYLAAPKLNY